MPPLIKNCNRWQAKGSFCTGGKVHAKKVPIKIKKWTAFANLNKRKELQARGTRVKWNKIN
jgi:hypothetical protein